MSSFESVDVVITDDTPAEDPISGVLVRVFDSTNTNFITSATTDGTGTASMTLPAPATYQVRFFKDKVTIVQPQFISVLEAPVAPATNIFEITGHVYDPPEAVNPRLCRCSGFFRDVTGAPRANVDLHIISKFSPILLEGDAVLTERVHTRSDKTGYIQLDLIRFAKYEVIVEGFENCIRNIEIPDAPSANLPDLLFPVVDSVSFDPPGPYTLAVGAELVITPTVLASDGRTLEGTDIVDVIWATEDTSIAVVLPAATTLTLRGIAAGSTNLTATRLDKSVIHIPDTGISGQPVVITIT